MIDMRDQVKPNDRYSPGRGHGRNGLNGIAQVNPFYTYLTGGRGISYWKTVHLNIKVADITVCR
jgi:hypothetical protein